MLRSQFITGFSRVLGLVHVLALLVWAVVIAAGGVSIYNAGAQQLWPYTRIYSDAASLLLAFICLGAPLVSFAFGLPIYTAKFVLAGFSNLDDEGIPQEDWLLFRLFGFVLTEAIPYFSKFLAWTIVLTALYLVDNDRTTDSLLTYITALFTFEEKNMPYLQIVAHGVVIISAIAVQFALWLSVGFRVEEWLESFFERKVLGQARTKAVLEYANTIAQREGFFPAIKKLLSLTVPHR